MNPRWWGPALALVAHALVLGWPVPRSERPSAPSPLAVSLAPRPEEPTLSTPLPTPPKPPKGTSPEPVEVAESGPVPTQALDDAPGSSAMTQLDEALIDQGGIGGGDPDLGQPSPAVEFNFDAWAAQVRQGVDAHKAYPYAARSRGLEGRVTVAVSVAPEGTLAVEPRVTRSSGYAVLDRAAVAAISDAAPFPGVPSGPPRDLELTLVFTLR